MKKVILFFVLILGISIVSVSCKDQKKQSITEKIAAGEQKECCKGKNDKKTCCKKGDKKQCSTEKKECSSSCEKGNKKECASKKKECASTCEKSCCKSSDKKEILDKKTAAHKPGCEKECCKGKKS